MGIIKFGDTDYPDINNNDIPDVFENRLPISEILSTEPVAPDLPSASVKPGAVISVAPKPEPSSLSEKWPEILEWQEGDEFDIIHSGGKCYVSLRLILIRDGYAFCNERLSGKIKLPLKDLIGRNNSARSRRVDRELSGIRNHG